MAAVGDRGDVAALSCLRRWGYVAIVAVCGRLFSWAVIVCRGRCGRSWLVVVSRCRSSCVLKREAPNKHYLLFITNT